MNWYGGKEYRDYNEEEKARVDKAVSEMYTSLKENGLTIGEAEEASRCLKERLHKDTGYIKKCAEMRTALSEIKIK